MSDLVEPVLATALQRLTENGTLTQQQADAVRAGCHAELQSQAGRPGEQRNSWTPVLAEVGGYVGAAFVTAAAVALVGPGWDNFSRAGRIAVLAGPAVLLLLAAVVVARARPIGRSLRPGRTGWRVEGHPSSVPDRRAPAATPVRRLIGALLLAGGGLLGAAAGVIADEHTGSGRWVPLVPLLVWGLGYLRFRGVALHLGTAAALTWTVLTVLDPGVDERYPVSGLLLVATATLWALPAMYRLIEERALAFAVAGVMAFTGGEIAATSAYVGLGYLLLGLLALIGLAGYVRTRELSILGVGAATLAVVVPQIVIDYTEGSLAAAAGLLVSGLSVVGASVLAVRLRRTGSGPTELV
jgi:hypothetical protein